MKIVSVIEWSSLTYVFKGGSLFVVDNYCLLLAFKNFVVLFELLVALKELIVRHFTANITADLCIFLVAIQLSLHLGLCSTLTFNTCQSCVILCLQIVQLLFLLSDLRFELCDVNLNLFKLSDLLISTGLNESDFVFEIFYFFFQCYRIELLLLFDYFILLLQSCLLAREFSHLVFKVVYSLVKSFNCFILLFALLLDFLQPLSNLRNIISGSFSL